MEASQRDSTEDWLLPRGEAPPLLDELELRIDEALATARASEQAVTVVGEAAIDAAKQARRAADMAEQASANALEASRAVASASALAPAAILPTPLGVPGSAGSAGQDEPAQTGDATMRSFSARADRVVARLRALERRPQPMRGPSAAAALRRPGG